MLELSGFDIAKELAIALPIINVEQMEAPVKISKQPLSQFVGLKDSLTLITLKNGCEFSPSGSHEKGSVPIFKRGGKLNVTTERYMHMIKLFKPDFFTTFADGDTYEDCPKKRIIKACERSEEMFNECITRRKASKTLQSCFMIASVEGGFNEWERNKMTEQLKNNAEDIDGYFIDGLHRNGPEATTLNVTSLKHIIDYTLSRLPADKLKLMLGAYLPHVTLELILMGIDLFDSSYVNLVTNCNRALTFNFDLNCGTRKAPELNLMDSSFKEDFAPFVENCQCYACRKHTRAYTNHLLLTHELLGPALLSIHNIHHYMKFFETIRESIKTNRTQELLKLVSDQYENISKALTYEVEVNPIKNKENA